MCLTGGRGYGGCAILWRSSLSCTVEPINLDNNRVCSIQVKLHDVSFMLCCVYKDTTYDRTNIDIYNEVFNDIFNYNICNDVEHIVIHVGGDLNTDLSRVHSGHTEYLRNICERESMKCVKFHDRCDIDYTYESKSNYARSCVTFHGVRVPREYSVINIHPVLLGLSGM